MISILDIFKRRYKLIAPVDGQTIDLSNVGDQVFSNKLAGDGIAIVPTGNIILSPADGKINLILKTNHAFSMVLNNGIEVLIHIGVDTMRLGGEGFERIAQEGDTVKCGQPVLKINNEFVEDKGFSLTTMVLITDSHRVCDVKFNLNRNVKSGESMILTYRVK